MQVNEPAFLLALQNDFELWKYAYDKKIILISPTTLIATLKLIVDLWKREYQNQNAQAIADRGAALYDKFIGFVNNMVKLGGQLDVSQNTYKESFGQLKSGKGNLVGQAEKLREGVASTAYRQTLGRPGLARAKPRQTIRRNERR